MATETLKESSERTDSYTVELQVYYFIKYALPDILLNLFYDDKEANHRTGGKG